MAKDIDISLPEGGEITVPAWSTEETQKQIYNVLKSMNGVDKETLKKLENAQRAEDKSDQKQIDALKQLSKDLKEGMNGGFLGGLAAAAGAAGGALGVMGKAVGITATAVAGMGTALVAGATAATKFATGYTDALQPLVDSGMAFGGLGKQVDQSIMDLNRLGFSSEDAAKLINNSSTAFLRLGEGALAEFTTNMKAATAQGERFGMVQDQATEFLLTELEERARSGIIERMNSTQFAAMQFQVLEDQISASRRLGKSVDQIADIQKEVMGDDRLTAVLNSVSGDQEIMLRELAANLSTYGLSNGEIADLLSAEISGKGMEATDVAASLIGEMSMIEGGFEGFRDSLKNSMKGVKTGNREMYESATADLYKNQELIGTSIENATAQGIKDGFTPMILLMEATNTRLLARGAGLKKSGQTGGEKPDKTDKKDVADTEVNSMRRTAVAFDNAVLSVTGAFTAEITRSQQEVNKTLLSTMTKTINDSGLVDDATTLAKIMGDMATDGIKKANDGLAKLSKDFVNFSKELKEIYGEKGIGGVAERIYQASVDNIVKPIGKAIMGLFTNPAVIAALVAAVAIPFAAQVVATAAAMAITKALVGAGGVDGVIPGDVGGDGKGKGKGKGSRVAGVGKTAFLTAGIATALSGIMAAVELAGDFSDINKDLGEGSITRSESQIAKTAETSEAVGGVVAGVVAASMAKGALVGSPFMGPIGASVGAMIAGGIAWYVGRAGARAMGEGLAEAVFTPEQEALENELLKIEERLTGDINRRSRAQLETRKQLVQAELDLMKPIEQTQPINPNNIPIMVTPPEDTEATDISTSPASQDGTPTQEVLSNQNATTPTDDLLRTLISQNESSISALEAIAKYTKGTAGSIAEVSQR